MRRKIVAKTITVLTLVFILVLCQVAGAIGNNNIFKDIPSNFWAADAIGDLASEGIVEGIGDNVFNPEGNVNRAEFTAMMFRSYNANIDSMVEEVENLAYENTTNPNIGTYYTMSDIEVQNGKRWYNNLIVASQKYALSDWGTTNSEWEKPITREEMAYVSMVIAEKVGNQEFKQTENIKNNIGDYDTVVNRSRYRDYILRAYSNGILIGVNGNGDYGPSLNATRAQSAVIIQRVLRADKRQTVEIKTQYNVPLETPKQEATQSRILRWDDPDRPAAREGDIFIDESGKRWDVVPQTGGVLLADEKVCLDIGRKMYSGDTVRAGAISDGRVSGRIGEVYYVINGHGDWYSNWLIIKKNSVKPSEPGTYDREKIGYWIWCDTFKSWGFPIGNR